MFSEVRRATLLNIPVNSETLPHILERTRDTDTTIRKFVYNNVLVPNVLLLDTDRMGSAHPRAMSIAQREVIIRNGLGDREVTVRNAAALLLGRWVEAVIETVPKEEEGAEKPEPKVYSGLVVLLKMLDLSDRVVPVDALLSLFATRPDIFNNLEFDGEPCSLFWSAMALIVVSWHV